MKLAQHAVCLTIDRRFKAESRRLYETFSPYVDDFKFFIDGDGQVLDESMYDQFHGRPPETWKWGQGAWQQFAAMRRIADYAISNEWDSLLFLEDDCVLTPEFDTVVAQALNDLATQGEEWDVLYLGANHTNAHQFQITPHVMQIRGSLCNHCVIFQRPVFEALAAMRPTAPSDVVIATTLHKDFGCYAVCPNVALQKPGISYIQNGPVDYTHLF